MFHWFRRQRTPKEEPAPQVQDVSKLMPSSDELVPEMGFNALYQAIVDMERGTQKVFRSSYLLRPDQLERIAFLVEGGKYHFDPETQVLTVSKPQL